MPRMQSDDVPPGFDPTWGIGWWKNITRLKFNWLHRVQLMLEYGGLRAKFELEPPEQEVSENMPNEMQTFRQGEDINFEFDLGGEPLTNWICTIVVKQYPSDVALISREIPAVGSKFPGYLTSTETAALNVSSDSPWTITALMVNATEIRQRQVTKRFHLSPAFTP